MGKFDGVLLATDFDNTLVDSDGAIARGIDVQPPCARNLQAIRYFTANGGRFTVSTGRAMAAFSAYAAQIPLNAPCVVGNGAAIYDYQKEEYLVENFLPETIYRDVQDVFARFPMVGTEVYHADQRVHSLHENEFVRAHWHFTRLPATHADCFDAIDMPIIKVLFEQTPEDLEIVRQYILTLPWCDRYEVVFSSPHLLEVTAKGASKGNMVLELARRLGIAREHIYCVGDHANDLSMLEVAAIPFAPANALPVLKEFGATVVCPCPDGAIAEVIDILDRRYS